MILYNGPHHEKTFYWDFLPVKLQLSYKTCLTSLNFGQRNKRYFLQKSLILLKILRNYAADILVKLLLDTTFSGIQLDFCTHDHIAIMYSKMAGNISADSNGACVQEIQPFLKC